MSKDKGGGGGDVIVQGGTYVRPKGFIEAISEIEWYYQAEKAGSQLPERFFTMKDKLAYFEVGFKGAFLSGLISVLLTPIAIGVIEKSVPAFGSEIPNLFDKVFVFLLALGFTIAYALFIARVGLFYKGRYTRLMINNFVGGVCVGAFLKAVVAFIFLHFMYLVVLKQSNLVAVVMYLQKNTKINPRIYETIYSWIVDFKPILLTSAWFIVIVTAIFIIIPLIVITVTFIKNKLEERNI